MMMLHNSTVTIVCRGVLKFSTLAQINLTCPPFINQYTFVLTVYDPSCFWIMSSFDHFIEIKTKKYPEVVFSARTSSV